ncbi:predicted protein [Postia placenta Mad-698-R]|nr:predicted protein [Postia placenta Mad-698-R]
MSEPSATNRPIQKSWGTLSNMRHWRRDIPRPPLDTQIIVVNASLAFIAAVPTRVVSFPVEIWLLIIDELGRQREYDALEAISLACEGEIHWRAKKYVPSEVTFRKQEEVASINVARRLRWGGPSKVCIEGGARSDERLPIPHLATFASRLAGKWFSLEDLIIARAEWRLQDLDLPSVSLNLSCFTSIKRFDLCHVTFPNALTFFRLVCALPSLKFLSLWDINIVNSAIDTRPLLTFPVLSALKLNSVTLVRPDEVTGERPTTLASHSTGILQWVSNIMDRISIERSPLSLQTSPWCNVKALKLWDVSFPTAAAFARLLGALPVLSKLQIQGPCMFSKHDFDYSDVPVIPGVFMSSLRELDLGYKCCLCSDPQSLDDLVAVFIRTGASDLLNSIHAWLPLFLRTTTSIDVAINRLVEHAGQSLHDLRLRVIAQDDFLLYNKAARYVGPSTTRCFNTSRNKRLQHLACSMDIARKDRFQIDSILELLHRATSTRISDFSLNLHVMDEVVPPKLWSSLSELDAVLSQAVFGKLAKVRIQIRHEETFPHNLEARVKSCLPKLDARGWDILWCVLMASSESSL